MNELPPNRVDIVLVAVGLILLLTVSILWVVWSRGYIRGRRIGWVNRKRPPKLVGRVTIGTCVVTVILTQSSNVNKQSGAILRFFATVLSIVSVELILTWVVYWTIAWFTRFGIKNPRVGEMGLDESDFQPLVSQLNSAKLRTDLMLFGSVTLGAIWWTHFANILPGGAGLDRVITLCGELSLGMLSLGIIALVSIGIDVQVLKFMGMARSQPRHPLAWVAHAVSVLMSKYGSIVSITLVFAWAIRVYFTEPLAPIDLFVLSIPLGVIWECAGKKHDEGTP